MTLADVRAQLEQDLTWRLDEMRFFHNQLARIQRESEQDRYRRALVLMLYSHYEGFCKTAFSIYAGALNQERIPCSEATDCIAAASLAEVFKAYEDPNRKSDVFRRPLPDDTQLHRFARQVELIGVLGAIGRRQVRIPVDSVVDTQSNLRPVILRKILYRLGFPHDVFAAYEGKVSMLVNRRNDIGHGANRSGVSKDDYEEVQTAARDVMDGLLKLIVNALKNEIHRKAGPVPS